MKILKKKKKKQGNENPYNGCSDYLFVNSHKTFSQIPLYRHLYTTDSFVCPDKNLI